MAAVMLSTPGCRGHRTPAPDASTHSVQRIQIEAGSAVDWKTACALGKAIGLPSSTAYPVPVMLDGPNADGRPYTCGSAIARHEVMFEAWGSTLEGADKLQLFGPAAAPKDPAAFAGHMLEFVDKLTQKVVGQPVPAVLRRSLLTNPKGSVRKTVELKGWTLVVVRRVANTYEYMIYSQ